MATQTQHSHGSLSQYLVQVREDLLKSGESELYQHTHSQPNALPNDEQHSTEKHTDNDQPKGQPAIVPESIGYPMSPVSSPARANSIPRIPTIKSAPADMELMITSTPLRVALKTVSFHGIGNPEGDTQPMPSQVYHDERESMRRSMAATNAETPMKARMTMNHNEPSAVQSVRSGLTSPRTLQQDQSGYVDLEAGFHDSSPVHSTQGDEGFDELLRDPSSPQTQFQVPEKPDLPETPAVAGQKHARDGELLTSATTAKSNTTSWGFSQFGQQKADLMGRSQLFAQTQAASSPLLDGPRSDPIQSRPSPNLKGNDLSSPLGLPNSSPAYTRNTYVARVPGEPRSVYRTMAEELQDRMNARAVSEQFEVSGDIEEDDIFDDDSYQERVRRKGVRRTLSDQAMISAARVKAPARPGSRHSKVSSRSSSTRKQRKVIDIVTPGPAACQEGDDDDDDDDLLGADQDCDHDGGGEAEEVEQDLLKRPNHEDDYEEQRDQVVENQLDDESAGDDDVDEYDELNQTLRSQAIDVDDYDQERSVADSVEQPYIDLQDLREDEEDAHLDTCEDVLHDTQRSHPVADSQHITGTSPHLSASMHQVQQSSLTTFVPGSQYAGRTSEEQAFLPSSQARSQSRVPASQLPDTALVGLPRPTGSPALPAATGTLPENSTAASPVRRRILQQFNSRSSPPQEESPVQEIPESDLPDADPEQSHDLAFESSQANEETQESNLAAPYSTARTHVSGSAQSPANIVLGTSPGKLLASEQIRRYENSPRKIAGVPRFAEMASLTPSTESFETVDVDDIMNAVMTDEDRKIVAMGGSAIEAAIPKRRKITCNRSSQEDGEHSTTYLKTGIKSTLRNNVPSKAEIATTTTRPSLSEVAETPTALRSSPSKGNELALPSFEEGASPSSTSESTKLREKQGAAAVSQLIAKRPITVSRKAKRTTYTGGRSRKKSTSGSSSRTAQKPAGTRRIVNAEQEDHDQPTELIMPHSADRAKEDSVTFPAETATTAAIEMTNAVTIGEHGVSKASSEQSNDSENHNVDGSEAPIVAPERIFALFKGTYHNFYPATYLGGSADGMTYKIRFDDTTVTNIETFHVGRLEFRIDDLVKVDVAGMKTKIWRIVGFAPPVQTTKERNELGVDTRGRARLKVQVKTSRTSLVNDTTSAGTRDDGTVKEVAVHQVYLTKTMWRSFQSRTFEQPLNAQYNFDRAVTPSSHSGTPSIETPLSRSRRHDMPPAKSTISGPRTSHLRDLSVASSNRSNSTAIFGSMAFAITYLNGEAQKIKVTKLIREHGGLILNDGFEELFDLPEILESSGPSPKGSSPAKNDIEQQTSQGLRLKEEYKGLTFVALITDHHSRRVKYMQALALGLPTLSGRWIFDSLDATRNASLFDGEVAPLNWERYLLPAGTSTYLDNAVRSRNLTSYDAATCELGATVAARPILLDGGSVLVVTPKKSKASWDKRKTFAFLTLALGAAQVKRVNDLDEAQALIQGSTDVPEWIYVDGDISEATAALFNTLPASKKRKRGSDAIAVKDADNMSATHGNIRVVNNEFVIQSLILGALLE